MPHAVPISGHTRELLAAQQSDAHWSCSFDQQPIAGAPLILDIPYRYLPIYQR